MANDTKAVRDPLLPLTHYQRIGKQPVKKNAAPVWITIGVFLLLIAAGGYLLHNEIEDLKQEHAAVTQPTLADEPEPIVTQVEVTPATTGSKAGEFCGGIAATQCAEGLTCQYEGTYPDAGGTCMSESKSSPVVSRPDMPVSSAPVSQAPTNPPGEMIMCTMDSMQCPDGSWIGRSGPKCEFKCPGQ